MNERINHGVNQSDQGEEARKEDEPFYVAEIALLEPEAASDYGLDYVAGRPIFVLNPSDCGQVCNVGEVVEAPKKASWDGLPMGVEFHRVVGDAEAYAHADSYGRGAWIAEVEPIGALGDGGRSLFASRVMVRAIRAFESSQHQVREIREGFVVAVDAGLKPVSGRREGLNPSYSFSIEDNGQVNFSPLV